MASESKHADSGKKKDETLDEALARLKSSPQGLTDSEAADRTIHPEEHGLLGRGKRKRAQAAATR